MIIAIIVALALWLVLGKRAVGWIIVGSILLVMACAILQPIVAPTPCEDAVFIADQCPKGDK